VLLPARNRVDLWLDLSEPVTVGRPFGKPLVTQRLAVASDEPERLVEQLLRRPASGASTQRGAVDGAERKAARRSDG
jgi:hypothetical protein